MDKVRAFLETYRVWPEGDRDLEQELTTLLDDYEQGEQFMRDVVLAHRLHEITGGDTLSDQETVAKIAALFQELRAVFDLDQQVDLAGDSPIPELKALLKSRDDLEAFRMQILGAVKSTKALAMNAYPDDNQLVIIVKALFP